MKRLSELFAKWVIYPVLFAVNEILILAGPNLANVKLEEAWRPMIWLAAASSLVLGALYAWSKNWHRAGLLTMLLLLWFAHFGFVVNKIAGLPGIEIGLPQMLGLFILWTAPFLLVASPWLWRKLQKPETLTQYFNLLTILLILFSLQRIYSYETRRVAETVTQQSYPPAPALQSDQRPDIYYIIADGYSSQAVLQEIYALDNRPFIDYLEQRGFYVAQDSRSNYIRTTLSMASALNFDYLPAFPLDTNDEAPTQWLQANNRLRAALEKIGYQTTWMTGYQGRSAQNILESLFWLNSVTALPVKAGLLPPSLPTYRQQQDLIQDQVAQLVEVAAQPSPKFVYLHILVPHPPFIYDQNGPIEPDEIYMLNDGATFPGSPSEYVQGYRQQIQYVNVLLRQAVENILTHSANPPVIIVQGDHGGGAYLTGDLEQSCIRERFSILNAYYLPGEAAQRLYPGITPVNTFRLVLSSYFGADIELITDEKSYFSISGFPYQYVDITERVSQPCELP